MGLIWSLILGAIAGFIATGIMQERSSWIKNILLGIGGDLSADWYSAWLE